jgi:hypothetical protein
MGTYPDADAAVVLLDFNVSQGKGLDGDAYSAADARSGIELHALATFWRWWWTIEGSWLRCRVVFVALGPVYGR